MIFLQFWTLSHIGLSLNLNIKLLLGHVMELKDILSWCLDSTGPKERYCLYLFVCSHWVLRVV